jgi:hypothetical protein
MTPAILDLKARRLSGMSALRPLPWREMSRIRAGLAVEATSSGFQSGHLVVN